MILRDLRGLLDKVPEEFDNFELLNGEMQILEMEGKETIMFRIDKAIVGIRVEDDSKEIIFLHQTEEDINNLIKEND